MNRIYNKGNELLREKYKNKACEVINHDGYGSL